MESCKTHRNFFGMSRRKSLDGLGNTCYQLGLTLDQRLFTTTTKALSFLRGPMRVVSGNNSRYKLYDLVTLKETMFHTSDMKL